MDSEAHRDTPITVVEPQSGGVFHAPFDAAMLHTVALANPQVRLCFEAAQGHVEQVAQVLREMAPEMLQRVEWHAFAPGTGHSLAVRWWSQSRLLRRVLGHRQRVLFCSISRMQLLELKRLMRASSGTQVRVVLHGELDLLDLVTPSLLRPFALERVLAGRNPAGRRYVVLGQSIREHIPARYSRAFVDAGVCDHPYHFAPPPAPPTHLDPPVFGVFGNAGGGELIEAVARQVRAADPRVRFRMIGFVSGAAAAEHLRSLVEEEGTSPLTRETFVECANTVTHALWLAPPDGFRLRASGTFFDALSYVKPLVYTANPFIDSYASVEPAIGRRCLTLADVAQSILELAQSPNPAEYARQQAAMLRLRERFTPQALAAPLARALDWDDDRKT